MLFEIVNRPKQTLKRGYGCIKQEGSNFAVFVVKVSTTKEASLVFCNMGTQIEIGAFPL